jgi:hypothetical protein
MPDDAPARPPQQPHPPALEAIRNLLAQATPAPWWVIPCPQHPGRFLIKFKWDDVPTWIAESSERPQAEADLMLAAYLRNNVDALLAAAVAGCRAAGAATPPALADMEARKDAAYLERNRVVAALAKCFPSGVARTAIEGWSEDWHGCVYIDLPTGQASWHFHDSQAHLFAGLPPYTKPWDGHDTDEKYRRVDALAAGAGAATPASTPAAAPTSDERYVVYRGIKALKETGNEPHAEALRDLVNRLTAGGVAAAPSPATPAQEKP